MSATLAVQENCSIYPGYRCGFRLCNSQKPASQAVCPMGLRALQHHAHGVARRAVSGFVACHDAALPILAALLVHQYHLGLVHRADLLDAAFAAFAALDALGRYRAAIDRLLPVEKEPVVAQLQGLEATALAGGHDTPNLRPAAHPPTKEEADAAVPYTTAFASRFVTVSRRRTVSGSDLGELVVRKARARSVSGSATPMTVLMPA